MIRQTALLLCAFALTTTTAVHAQATAVDDRPRIMVLGTFHFTGGGQDMINPEVDDFLSDHRQAEIDDVLDRLAAFAPTKILVELTPEHEDSFNDRYAQFRAGEISLGVNERQQIGMRLAARFDHDRLYAVDYHDGMDFNAMLGGAEAAGQTRLLSEWESYIAGVQTRIEAVSSLELSVGERLRLQNTPETVDMHDLYLLLAQMGSADNPAGAEQMIRWWGRNMRIYANIAQVSEPGDRVLVIYGSGHKALLDEFIEGAPNLIWVDALPYLE